MKRISDEDLQHIYSNCANVWEKLRGKSIFVTGATGFFGKWLLESFLYANNKLSLNASLCALSRDPESFLTQYPFYNNQSSITFIKGDIKDFSFPVGAYQFIIHAATDADAQLNNNNPLLMLDTITAGTKRVLEFAATKPIEAFLYISSGAVYGKQRPHIERVSEKDYYDVNLLFDDMTYAYAESKRISELYCLLYYKQSNLPIKIARCFAFVGPYLPLDKHFAIGNFILNAINNEDIIIKGDGCPLRSYLYASDLATWLWTILLSGENNTAYNVGSDNAVSIRQTAEIVAKSVNNNINIKVMSKSLNLPIHRYVPDIKKAQSELNLDVQVNLSDAIIKTINFYN